MDIHIRSGLAGMVDGMGIDILLGHFVENSGWAVLQVGI